MSLIGRLFQPSKRLALDPGTRQWYLQACNVIKMAVAHKLLANCRREWDDDPQRYEEDRAFALVAAVCNRLFASPSPAHSAELLKDADELAETVLKSDDEVRYAAVMGCRAYLLCNAEADSELRWLIWDTLQWMASVCKLPAHEADPDTIEKLSNSLHAKYLRKT